MALSIMVNVVVYTMYSNSQRALIDAQKDLKTQVWVRQNDEDERFQKFLAGPYATLAGEVKASQILYQQCQERRK
jgi:hypothetical protein